MFTCGGGFAFSLHLFQKYFNASGCLRFLGRQEQLLYGDTALHKTDVTFGTPFLDSFVKGSQVS